MNDFAASEYQNVRAPRQHGEATIVPSLDSADALRQRNVELSRSLPSELTRLRENARRQLLVDAERYSSAYRNTQSGSAETIVMAGHQPTLFHSGVWFKNFALDHLARSMNATAVNLVIDSDVSAARSIRVPHLAGDSIRYETVPYDRGGQGVPFEQTLIESRESFDRFDEAVTAPLMGIVDEPIVRPLWEHAREAIQRCGFAGCAIAQARHAYESEVGLESVEVPQSVVCRSLGFVDFTVQILREAERFRECYNSAADTFRAAHGIRSSAHPVPNLGRDGDWIETPLWLYGNQSPQRRGVWVRRVGAAIEITDRARRQRRIENIESADAAESLAGLFTPEFKLRSRALITTMYARLVLSDLFLHGIGGGKYDELGGQIAADFWGIQPPSFMVLSATVHLPGAERDSVENVKSRIASMHRQTRDTIYQPERFESADPNLVAAKRELLAKIPPRGQRSEWHHQLSQVNQQLSAELDDVRRSIRDEITRLEKRLRETLIWTSREHPFCIFPLEHLRGTFARMLGDGSSTRML